MSLKHAILVQLEIEPSSGYDLTRLFKQGMGYFWNAKHQQIYQQLKKLSADKLIRYEVENQLSKPDKKIYAITPEGEIELKRWIGASVKPAKVNDALLVKLYGGHLTSTENLLAELQLHITTHQKTLKDLKAIEDTFLKLPKTKQQQYRLPYLTLRRGILGEQAWLDWANEAINAIKK